MSPIAPPKKASAARSGGSSGRASSASGESKKASSSSPSTSSIHRTPKIGSLREKVVRFYMMIGTIMVPFGRFIPQLKPIGENLKIFAEEAADAWIDLAEEDPRVKSYLESFVGASTWGNVIGVHFVIMMGAMPDQTQKIAEAVMPEGIPDDPKEAMDMLKAMGASDEQIKQAFDMAQNIVSDRPPEPSLDHQKERDEMKEEIKNLTDLKNKQGSSMASPEQMNVRNDGQQQYSGPMNTGGIK